MKKLVVLLALLPCGCRAADGSWTVVGSASVESDKPDGKAAAKLEVRYQLPPVGRPETRPPTTRPKPSSPSGGGEAEPPARSERRAASGILQELGRDR